MKNAVNRPLVADFIDDQIAKTKRTAVAIADEVGFPKANFLSMIRTGRSKVPSNRIQAMARALRVDEEFFLDLVMNEYEPELWRTIKDVTALDSLTSTERNFIKILRKSKAKDLTLTDEASNKLLKALDGLKGD